MTNRTTPHDGSPEATSTTVLHRVMFSPVTPIASEQLYIDVSEGGTLLGLDRTSVTLSAFTSASTRTYFGRFPAAYYQRWTGVRKVSVRATVTGSGRLRVFASDDIDRERIVGSQHFTDATGSAIAISVDIDRFLDGGFLWVSIEAGAEAVTVSDVSYHTDAPAKQRARDIVVCTHNRADDCVATLQAYASDDLVLALTQNIYVVDQGTQTVADAAGFAEVQRALGDKLRYIRQPNLGGAGGFSRGLYESLAGSGAAKDVILMDDDIVLEPETLVRMAAFASLTLQPLLVGAQMLYLYHPNVLHTAAETADLQRLRAGVPVNEHEHAIDLTKQLPYKWAEGGYNAWWTCLIPSEAVDKVGYPLSMFFQWDDIEFGLRARARGIPTVTLTGSAVWHADFSLKDRDDWSRYFSTRNSLIVAALHSSAVPRRAALALSRDIVQLMLAMQYGLIATMLSGIDGFLEGPRAIKDGGAEALRGIRELRGHYPDTIRHPPAEIVEQGLFTLPAVSNPGPPRIPSLVVAKRLAYQLVGLNRSVGKLASADNSWHHSALFKEAIVTDAGLDAFRIRRFERRTSWRLTKRAAATMWRLLREGRRVSAAWRRALPAISSREMWTRLYDA